MTSMPKQYSPEEKARAVRMVREHLAEYGSITATSQVVGQRLGISRESLRRWVTQTEIDDGVREGVTSEEAEEIARLRAENRRLREDVEILKAATTFFVGALDPRRR
jgi:transposase